MKKKLLFYLKKIIFKLEKLDAYLSRKFKFVKENWQRWKKVAPQYKEKISKTLKFYLKNPFFFIHFQRDLVSESPFFKKIRDIRAAYEKLEKEQKTHRKEDYFWKDQVEYPTPKRQAKLAEKLNPWHWFLAHGWFVPYAIIGINAVFCFLLYIIGIIRHTNNKFMDTTFKAVQNNLSPEYYMLKVGEYYRFFQRVWTPFIDENGNAMQSLEKINISFEYFRFAQETIDGFYFYLDINTVHLAFVSIVNFFGFQVVLCSIIFLAKVCLFLLLIYFTVFIFRFCVFGSTRYKAIEAYRHQKSYKYFHIFYTFLFFLFFAFILFLLPGIDTWFIACGYIPPFRWLYVDFLSYFQGSFFYTETFWTGSRIWIPHTYGQHVLHFLFFFPGDATLSLYHEDYTDFLISLQKKTYDKELQIFMDTFLHLREVCHGEQINPNFSHQDFSIFYFVFDFVRNMVKDGFV